jgi:hypothetical protein
VAEADASCWLSSDICLEGVIVCSDGGVAECQATGLPNPQAYGISCNPETSGICSDGNCVGCVPGACTPWDTPCQQGTIDCDAGPAGCGLSIPLMLQPAGTSCGPTASCSDAGACVLDQSCTPVAACQDGDTWTSSLFGQNSGYYTVTRCGLVLVAIAGSGFTVAQEAPLAGDFDLTLQIPFFIGTHASVSLTAPSSSAEAILSTYQAAPGPGLVQVSIASPSLPDGGAQNSTSPTFTSATVELIQTGPTLTVDVEAGGQSASVSGAASGPYTLSLSAQSTNHGSSALYVSAIAGTADAGSFQGDDFSCDDVQ